MATKSFTRIFSFTPASADSLLEAMEKDVTPNLADISNVKFVDNPQEIKEFFNKAPWN